MTNHQPTPRHSLAEFMSRPLGVDFEALTARNKIEGAILGSSPRGNHVARHSDADTTRTPASVLIFVHHR